MSAYLIAMAISAGIYALLALGVNLTWGMAGLVNLGLAGFFAVGGYTTALLTKSGIAIPFGIIAAALAAAATGAVVALITARLRADYLAIVTLGFSESVRIAAANEIWLTNGSDGIAGIPGPWRGTLDPRQFNLVFLGIVIAVLITTLLVMQPLEDLQVRHQLLALGLRAQEHGNDQDHQPPHGRDHHRPGEAHPSLYGEVGENRCDEAAPDRALVVDEAGG